jgi:23S rRNA (cytosine1962-C5)-methyltransferase
VTVVRPEPQAMWAPASADWMPDATFVPGSDEEGGGRWVEHRPVPRQWELSRGAVRFDASKKSVEAARGNALLSGLADAPIRWLVDDAAKFAAREVRRGRRYDGILLDPPKYGRGPDGEVWKLEEGLPGLIADCRRLLDGDSRFLFLTVYAVRMSALAIGELLRQTLGDLGGTIEAGELAVREEARGLALPTAIWARWSR